MSVTVEPETYTEKVIAGEVEPASHLEKVIAQYSGKASPEEIKNSVNDYLAAHPVQAYDDTVVKAGIAANKVKADIIDSTGDGTKYLADDGTYKTVSGGTGGTTDYADLENKPSINSVELTGNKTLADLGITNYDDTEIQADIANKVDKVTGKSLVADSEITRLSTVENYDDTEIKSSIGDIDTLTVTSVSDLVGAINKLNTQFMQSVSFANSTVTLVYKNGATFNIDVSPIITDTNIEELSNVQFTANEDLGNDNDVMMYNQSLNKWVNRPYSTFDFLPVAKAYTDSQINSIQHTQALMVDSKPTVDESQDGTWYYYTVDGVWKQTIYINGVEITIDTGSIDLSEFITQEDVVSEFAENPVDQTKIPTLAWMGGMYNIITTALNKKINVTDIIDNLNSDATNKPLSAKQGKELNTKIGGLYLNNSYSTTETLTGGTWIDGKPIYRKVLQVGGAPKAINVAYLNIDMLVKIDSMTGDSTDAYSNVGTVVPTTVGSFGYFYIKSAQIVNSQFPSSYIVQHLTIEYTKTTD